MSHCFFFIVAVFIIFAESPSYGGESADNRSGKTWSFEGTSGYRSYDVREYSLGFTRFDHLSPSMGGTSLVFGRLWTKHISYANKNTWKLTGHSIAGSYRKFLGNSFFVEASLLAEFFEAWTPSQPQSVNQSIDAEDFGNTQRLSMTVQAGNQWQWENLNFGITWFGRIVPLLHKVDNRGRNESFHRYLISPSNLGIRISLGWAI